MKCQSLFSGDDLHELSKLIFCPQETIFMKCQSLFSSKNKKNIVFLSSVELAERVVNVRERTSSPWEQI